ncbi:MAG TPA: hypothetical protein VG841_01030 [Caulobacterales bacterium]|nr:hypothetical protein [Caulobacterales bacterium]
MHDRTVALGASVGSDWLTRARRAAGIVRRSPRSIPRALKGACLQRLIDWTWPDRRPQPRRHALPGRLVVSLTSFPPRFPTLAATLKCLLSQTVAADDVILWIAHGDAPELPEDVRALTRYGLTIEFTEDLRSFKKIIPTLAAFPDAFVATADDDVYYPETWLEEACAAYDPQRREALCHRAHGIGLDAAGLPLPYRAWRHDVRARESSPLLFPTGIGGVLFPPGTLHDDVRDVTSFTRLCPTADDIWLYWMVRRAGALVRRVGPRRDMVTWPSSQTFSLHRVNAAPDGANDVQIRNMIARYGFPLT